MQKESLLPGLWKCLLLFFTSSVAFAVYITTFLSNYQMLARLGPAVSSLPNGTRSQTRLQSGPRFTFRNGSVGQAKPQSEHQPATNTISTISTPYNRTHTPPVPMGRCRCYLHSALPMAIKQTYILHTCVYASRSSLLQRQIVDEHSCWSRLSVRSIHTKRVCGIRAYVFQVRAVAERT